MTEQKLIEATNAASKSTSSFRRFVCALGLTTTLAASLLAVVISIYTYQAQTQQQELINQQLNNTSMLSSTLKDVVKNKPVNNTPEVVGKIQDDIVALNQKVAEVSSQMKTVDDRITSSTVKNNTSTELALSEVKNLLRLADLQLRYSKDRAAAILILAAADEFIATMTEPNILAFRQKLTDKITELKAIPENNKEPLLLKIKQLTLDLSQLELTVVVTPKLEENTVTQPATNTTTQSTWRNAWQLTLKKLERIIVVKEINPQQPPIFYPEQQRLLRENLQLLMQQMQWAVLINDNNLLQKCVSEIRLILENYVFSNKSTITQALSTLTEMTQVNLNPTFPDLSGLISDFQQVINNVHAALPMSDAVHSATGDKK